MATFTNAEHQFDSVKPTWDSHRQAAAKQQNSIEDVAAKAI